MSFSTTLADAALNGDIEQLCNLLDEGFDVNSPENQPYSHIFLRLAYSQGHNDFVRILLEAGLDLKSVVFYQLLPNERNLSCLAELLRFKVYNDVLKAHNKQFRALFQAALRKCYSDLPNLLKKFHSSKSCDKSNQAYTSLLFILVYDPDCPPYILQALIDNGANVNASFYEYKIWIFAIICDNSNGLKILLENGSSLEEIVSGSFSSFYYAIKLSNVECLILLLNYSDVFSLEVWKGKGIDLILSAVQNGQGKCLDVLLKYGATVERCEEDKADSPLILASKNENATMVDSLLQHGANVNRTNDCGETALINAALGGHMSCLDLLILHGADVNAVDCDRESALMHAIQRNRVNCVRNLINAGADTSIVSLHKHTALLLAVSSVHSKECLELVLSTQQFQCNSFILNESHKDAFALALRQFDVTSLLVLLNHRIFTWHWLDDFKNLPSEILARVLVAAGISPGCFQMNNQTTSLFQYALVAQDVWTLHYLLVNLYLCEHDYKHLFCDTKMLLDLKEKGHSDVVRLVESLSTQPLQLQTMCFLTLSTILSLGDHKISRKEKIKCLPIPNKFKSVLNFQGAYSSLCVDKWKLLGPEIFKMKKAELFSVFKNLNIDTTPCEVDSCRDNTAGYRLRFGLLKKRTARLHVCTVYTFHDYPSDSPTI